MSVAVHHPGRHHRLRSLAAGLAAALAAGGVWAAIGIWTEREYGMLALLVGVAVGLAVRFAGGRGSQWYGVLAALLAAAGILFGKTIIAEHALVRAEGPLNSIRLLGEALSGDIHDEHLTAYLQRKLEGGGELPDPMAAVDTLEEQGVDEESEQYRKARAAAEQCDAANQAAARQRFEAMPPEAKKQLAGEITDQQVLNHYIQKLTDDGTLKFTLSEEEMLEKIESVDEAEARRILARYDAEAERNQAEAARRLALLSAAERGTLLTESRALARTEMAAFKLACRMEVYKGMFNGLDIAFFLAALIAAWQSVAREPDAK